MEPDPDDYCEITSQLDAREILRYLNNLGIHNISGEVLKYFISDLKKFIKYDLQHKDESSSARTQDSEILGPERLHSASTFSSRIKSKVHNTDVKCSRVCEGSRKRTSVRTHSAPNLFNKKTDDKLTRRACSCIQVDKKPEIHKEMLRTAVSGNLIKVPKQHIKRKSDPVSLYHYYTSLWAKYKPNVPGENDWSDLRWNIRQKMAGNVVSHTSGKGTEMQDKHSVKKKKTPTTD